MKRLFSVPLFAILGLFSSLAFAGTAHYVDCSCESNGNGSFASPWNNIASVNSHSFSTGDDVYFKVNTTCTPSSELEIDWDGTADDRIIIGAYYGDGQFGLNGNSRPILDGSSWTVPDQYKGLIMMQSQTLSGHVTIQDLRVNDSARYGILTNYVDDVIIDKCYIYRAKKNGIVVSRCDTATISDNVVEQASYLSSPCAGITITALDNEGSSTNVTVRGNKVFHCYEGIGLYKMVTNSVVEYNHLYDNRSYQIYLDSSSGIVIRYNVVYGSADWRNWTSWDQGPSNGIVIDCEQKRCEQFPSRYPYGGSNRIYGNLVAWTRKGIALQDDAADFAQTNNKIYNNTIVDCNYNIHFGDNSGWAGNEVKNNISWTLSSGSNHSNNYSRSGVTWSHNNFDDPVSGNAANNAKIYNPQLTKTSGWRSIQPGTANGTEWRLQQGSRNKDNGTSISGYNARIYDVNFTADPIRVSITTDSTPDIGAWTLTGTGSLSPPCNMRLVQR